MNIPDLISLVQIGFALLAGLLVWRLITLSEQARAEFQRQLTDQPEQRRQPVDQIEVQATDQDPS